MAFLKSRTKLGKVKRAVKVALSYLRAYLFYHGWSSYVWRDGRRPLRVGSLRFCADPFLFKWKGTNWLFYESLDKTGKGYIGCYKEENGKWLQQGKVLEEPWHLSYPQVFEEDGKVYMIPESCDSGKGCVSLYEAMNFPCGWKKVATLIDKPFIDSTVLLHARHWYMACYTNIPKGAAELWHASTLLGPWRRHPMWDKINQSRRLRRCGGAFLHRDGKLYRVAQDCNGVYGKRLYLIELLELSPISYREGGHKLLHDKSMSPQRYCHTYNEIDVNGERLAVMDFQHETVNWPHRILLDIIAAMMKKIIKRKG